MANKKYKLTDGNYWATDGVYDFDQGKTQREVNGDLIGAIKQQLPTGGWICGVYGFITNGAKDIRLTVPIASYSATTVRVTDKISSIVAALRIPSGGYVAGLDTDITNYLVYADLASGGRGLSMRFTKDSAWTDENGVALPNNIPVCGLITITTNDDI